MRVKRLPEFDSLNDLSIILFSVFGQRELSVIEGLLNSLKGSIAQVELKIEELKEGAD